jgi:hypothetical protein
MSAGQPDFLEFFSRNLVRWKYSVNYTLTNVVGSKERWADPTRPKGQNPLLWKKSEIRVQIVRFVNFRGPRRPLYSNLIRHVARLLCFHCDFCPILRSGSDR